MFRPLIGWTPLVVQPTGNPDDAVRRGQPAGPDAPSRGGAERDASTAEDFPLGPVGGSSPDHTFDSQEPRLEPPR